jgi:hypothetical protein
MTEVVARIDRLRVNGEALSGGLRQRNFETANRF